jgi:Flp pilus assembly protein TadD
MDINALNTALQLRDWPRAAALLAPVTQAPGAHPSLLFNHGKVALELGHMAQAQALLRRAVQSAPQHQPAWFELGRAALAAGALPEACTAFGQALALAPNDGDARLNWGRIALRLGRYALAQEAWQPLAGTPEADLALYRIAAETRSPNAPALRQALLHSHPQPAAVLRALVRVSQGAIPLRL